MEETAPELETESREEELSRKTLVGHSFFFSQTFAPFSTCVSENRPLVGIFRRLEKGGCAITGPHMWTTHAPITLTLRCLHQEILQPSIAVLVNKNDLVGLALVKLVEYVAGHCWMFKLVPT